MRCPACMKRGFVTDSEHVTAETRVSRRPLIWLACAVPSPKSICPTSLLLYIRVWRRSGPLVSSCFDQFSMIFPYTAFNIEILKERFFHTRVKCVNDVIHLHVDVWYICSSGTPLTHYLLYARTIIRIGQAINHIN